MWLPFAFLSICAYALSDLLGKKKVSAGDGMTPVEMLLSLNVLAFCVGIAFHALGMGESGESPWRLLWNHPLIAANALCYVLYNVLYLCAMRFIGLAMVSAVSGANGILYFLGIVLVNVISGKLTIVSELFQPMRLIPILLVLSCTCLLPNLQQADEPLQPAGFPPTHAPSRRQFLIGFLFLMLAIICDAVDTLLTTVILDDGQIGYVDFVMVAYFAAIAPIILVSLYLRKRQRRWYVPFIDGKTYSVAYPCVAIASSLLYLYASSREPVLTGIVFFSAPVFPIVGAQVILKEKYTWKQNLCLWTIVIATIVFCAADYIQ